MTRPLSIIARVALMCAFAACASRPGEEAPTSTDGKVRAPVTLALTTAGTRAALTLTLRVQATADIPRAVARFTLPPDVVPLSGAVEQDLGPLARDAVVMVTLDVRVPTTLGGGDMMLAAGVDCHLASGVKLYGVTHVMLDPTMSRPGPSVRDLRRDALRASPARKQVR